MKYLGIDVETLKSTNSYNTAYEICSQPEIWRTLLKSYDNIKGDIKEFFRKIKLDESFDIIFTGAGTSEYIGNILEPFLNKEGHYNFKSIATTDIVNNPEIYLKKNKKTLLVSFARSGDSPESLATVNLVNDIVDEAYHLFITCNENGQLANISKVDNNCFLFLMPEGTNDKGFAMTSSFSSMLISGILVFSTRTLDVEASIAIAELGLTEKLEKIKELAYIDNDRIVVLGSGVFKGLAQELTLKVMELSRGLAVAKFDTVLGFRHGPKSIVDNKTIVFLCNSVDEYARKYDLGLYSEMFEEKVANRLVTYTIDSKDIKNVSTDTLNPSKVDVKDELTAILTYLIYGQMYAFFKSQFFKLTTDNPFPTGEVNRVVKKFEIHKYRKEAK